MYPFLIKTNCSVREVESEVSGEEFYDCRNAESLARLSRAFKVTASVHCSVGVVGGHKLELPQVPLPMFSNEEN